MHAGGSVTSSLRSSLELIGKRLQDCGAVWLVGGSCGLLLQGVELAKPPRDIDMYINRSTVPIVHERLREWALEEPHYSETPIYRSTLGHYDILGHTLEAVGGFEVEALGCLYEVDVELLEMYAAAAPLGDGGLKLMPLAHELLFNLLRGRPDRYNAVAAIMRSDLARHEPALQDLLGRGRWSDKVLQEVRVLQGG